MWRESPVTVTSFSPTVTSSPPANITSVLPNVTSFPPAKVTSSPPATITSARPAVTTSTPATLTSSPSALSFSGKYLKEAWTGKNIHVLMSKMGPYKMFYWDIAKLAPKSRA
ncbi:hypothetical protein MHYP_G00216720 [Metynnis hypsauchen]